MQENCARKADVDEFSTASKEELSRLLRRLVVSEKLSMESIKDELAGIREETELRVKRAARAVVRSARKGRKEAAE